MSHTADLLAFHKVRPCCCYNTQKNETKHNPNNKLERPQIVRIRIEHNIQYRSYQHNQRQNSNPTPCIFPTQNRAQHDRSESENDSEYPKHEKVHRVYSSRCLSSIGCNSYCIEWVTQAHKPPVTTTLVLTFIPSQSRRKLSLTGGSAAKVFEQRYKKQNQNSKSGASSLPPTWQARFSGFRG
jgi:hypothetical protein